MGKAVGFSSESVAGDNKKVDTTESSDLLKTSDGISLNDIEEITSTLSSNMDDIKMLGDFAKKMSEKKADKHDRHKDCDGTEKNSRILAEDLSWAVNSSCMKSRGDESHLDQKENLKRTMDVESGKSFSHNDLRRIKGLMALNGKDAHDHLPGLSIVDLNNAQANDNLKVTDKIQIKTSDKGTESYDQIHGIRTVTRDGVTYADLTNGGRVTRDSERDTTTYTEDGRKIYELLPNGDSTIGFDERTSFKAGEKRLAIMDGDKQIGFTDGTLLWMKLDDKISVDVKGAKTAEEALAILKARQNLEGIEETIFLKRRGGVSIVKDGKIVADLSMGRGPDSDPETSLYLSESQMIVRQADGSLLLKTKGQADQALSDEQTKALVESLGENAKYFAELFRSLGMEPAKALGEKGRAILGNQPEQDPSQASITPTFRFLGDHIETVVRGSTYIFDSKEGCTTIRNEEGKTAEIRKGENGFDVETDKVKLENGVAKIKGTGVEIDSEGAVKLPNGAEINTRGDITFADGKQILSDGRISHISDNQSKSNLDMKEPTQKSLDTYMSFARGLARSVAGRVKTGSVSLSDVAMLRANLSILGNYMNFFSQTGNLEIVNTINSSWTLVKASLNEAEPLVKWKQEEAKYLLQGDQTD